ncbi:MAG: hypothetical protein IT497_00325 [Ottowia sp.]|nr:hypothetical protein [Ottowia sp.]
MNLNIIIAELRKRCPLFEQRVGGAAEFSPLPEGANLVVPAAYVIPLDDEVGPPSSGQGYRQTLTEGFTVVVALSNKADERGQSARTMLDQVRAALWRVLLGWSPAPEYSELVYEGGNLMLMDRARLYFGFEFSTQTQITTADTRQGQDIDRLEPVSAVALNVDAIEPMADPNYPQRDHPTDPNAYAGGYPGVDGRIEHSAHIKL